MKTKCYSVFDTKAAVFGAPFFSPKDGLAVRMFTDLVNDRSTTVGRHPEDFTLYVVGEFDDETGTIASQKPVALVTASSLVRQAVVEREISRAEVVS